MAEKIEQSVFVPLGGMNQDDGYFNPSPDANGRSAFEQGDFRYALNVRTGVSNADNIGDAEILASTLEVAIYKTWNGSAWVNAAMPTGVNFPIGKYEDKQLRKVFFVLHNSNNQHVIGEYRSQEKAVYELLRWDGLNLVKKYISMARIGNYLIITQKGNKPRIIDFTTIFSLKQTLGAKFCEFHISFSKWAPAGPPVLRGFEIGNGTPELKKGLFQFSYRYVFIGGFRSRWSPLSQCVSSLYTLNNVAMASIRLMHPGLIYDSVDINNPRNHQDEEFYRVIEYIELAFRSSSIDVWRIYKTIKPTNPADLMLSAFINKTIGTPVDPNDFSQDYDEVPLASGCCEVIDNRVMFGNNLEEHEFVDDNDFIEGVETYSTGASFNSWLNTFPKSLFSGFQALSTADDALLTDMNKIRQQAYKSRGIYKHAVEFRDETGKKSLAYTTDAWINYIPDSAPDGVSIEKIFACGFKFKDSFKPPIWATSYQILRTNCINIDYFIFGVVNQFKLLVDDVTPTDDTVTNPVEARTMANDFFNSGPSASSLPLFSRYIAQTRKTKVITDVTKASRIFIDITNWYNAAKNTGSDTDYPLNKIFYEYLQGDYVRFYASTVASPTDDQIKIYDVPIIEFTGRGIIIEKPAGIAWVPGTGVAASKYVVEVYRPKKALLATDLVYYEMGEWYPVTNPGTPSRDFLKRDWRWTSRIGVSATQYKGHYAFHKLPLFAGDIHRFNRDYFYNYRDVTYTGVFNANIASMNPDPELVYDRWERNNGRPNTAYTSKPLIAYKETQIRFGGKYFQDALYNNINNFVPRDQYLYPQEYGSITEIMNVTSYQVESVGSILFALFSNKTVSIYINRTTLQDLSGRTQISLSDRVLGAYNSSLGDNGCINPESISYSNKGNVYWWDQFSANWVRYGRDGNTEISSYNMSSWFKELGEVLEPLYTSEDQPWIISEFDSWMGELLTYVTHPSMPALFRGYADYKGVVFNEDRNQWKYVHSYDAEMYGKVNNEIIGFKENKIFIHEGGNDYGSLYGTKRACKIEPVFNINANQNKLWQTISEIASHRWSVERTLSEYFGSRIEQESSLALDKLIPKEFTFYSELLADRNTPNYTNPDLAKVNGDRLRSKIIRVLLRLDDQVVTRSLLHMIILGYADSPKNL